MGAHTQGMAVWLENGQIICLDLWLWQSTDQSHEGIVTRIVHESDDCMMTTMDTGRTR